VRQFDREANRSTTAGKQTLGWFQNDWFQSCDLASFSAKVKVH